MDSTKMSVMIGMRTGMAVNMQTAKQEKLKKRMNRFNSLMSDRLLGGIRNAKQKSESPVKIP